MWQNRGDDDKVTVSVNDKVLKPYITAHFSESAS